MKNIVKTYESNFGMGPVKKLPWWAWLRRRRQNREIGERLERIYLEGALPEEVFERDLEESE